MRAEYLLKTGEGEEVGDLFTRRAGVTRTGGGQTDRIQAGHRLAVHLARHLSEGGTVRELGAASDEGEDGFALNEEQLAPVT